LYESDNTLNKKEDNQTSAHFPENHHIFCKVCGPGRKVQFLGTGGKNRLPDRAPTLPQALSQKIKRTYIESSKVAHKKARLGASKK
jgi:hypothetical protein